LILRASRISDPFEEVAAVRYDNAHGIAHRDRLNRRGEFIETTSMDATTLGEALNEARHAIKSEWRTFLANFLGTDS
jgi:hypothetical protein